MTGKLAREGLFARRRFGVRLGLEALGAVDQVLASPCEGLPCVSIVGTNGKGSTAAMLAHVLKGRGLRVGLFTSPHLAHVEERIRINDVPVSPDKLDAALTRVLAAEEQTGVTLTFFEVLTVAALLCFLDAEVEVLVLEAGLGGRLDSTRLRSRHVVLVARVAMDHQQWLGDTVEAIAAEKIAILEQGSLGLTQAQEAGVYAVLRRHAALVHATLELTKPLQRAPLGLQGEHQRHNGGLALAGAEAILRAFPGKSQLPVLASELDGATWPGRLEWVWPRAEAQLVEAEDLRWLLPARRVSGTDSKSDNEERCATEVLLDVAHNPNGMTALAAAVLAIQPWRPDLVLFGALADKDAEGMLAALAPILGGVELWLVSLDGGLPVASARELASLERVGTVRNLVLVSEGPLHAPRAAPLPLDEESLQARDDSPPLSRSAAQVAFLVDRRAKAGDRVLICGSFHLVGPLRAALLGPAEGGEVDPNDPRHAHSLRAPPPAR